MRKAIEQALANLRAQGSSPRYVVINCNEWTDDQLACFKVCAREFDLKVAHEATVPRGEMMLTENKP